MAAAWAVEDSIKPTFTSDDFMMPYAASGLVKIAREQGEWASAEALAILGGAKAMNFSIPANEKAECYFNPRAARASGPCKPLSRICAEIPAE